MIKLVALFVILGLLCIYKVIKELRKVFVIDLTQDDYDERY